MIQIRCLWFERINAVCGNIARDTTFSFCGEPLNRVCRLIIYSFLNFQTMFYACHRSKQVLLTWPRLRNWNRKGNGNMHWFIYLLSYYLFTFITCCTEHLSSMWKSNFKSSKDSSLSLYLISDKQLCAGCTRVMSLIWLCTSIFPLLTSFFQTRHTTLMRLKLFMSL